VVAVDAAHSGGIFRDLGVKAIPDAIPEDGLAE
jgi:hypothetical protein